MMSAVTRRGWRFVALALGLPVAALTACDPCSGLSSCVTSPRLTVEGRIVEAATGGSVDHVLVALVTDGAGRHDSIATTTDVRGFYQLSVPMQSSGPVAFDMVVSPPEGPTYRVAALHAEASDRAGDAADLGLWVSDPYFEIAGEVILRAQRDVRVPNTPVTFVRTGGAELTGPGWTSTGFHSMTDGSGRVRLFGYTVFPSTLTPVTGQLTAQLFFGPSTEPVTLTPTYEFRPAPFVQQIPVGPTMVYQIGVYNRATVVGVPGVRVDFQRTGGVETAPPTTSGVSDAGGTFLLNIRPLTFGTVIGDLTIHAPPPSATYIVHDVQFPVMDTDSVRFFGSYGVGLHFPWFGIVQHGGARVAGAEITAQRIDGAPVSPSTVVTHSDANGQFGLNGFVPQDTGTVLLDITVRPPAPFTAFIVHGISLAVLDRDSMGQFPGSLVFDLDHPPGTPLASRRTR